MTSTVIRNGANVRVVVDPLTDLPAFLDARLDGIDATLAAILALLAGGVPSTPTLGTPSITSDGTPQAGETGTGVDGAVTNLGSNTLTRRWLLGSTVLTTTANYTWLAAGVYTFQNRIIAPDGTTVLATASANITVAAAPLVAPAITTAPSFTGTARVGQVLTGARGSYTNGPTGYANKWQASADSGTTWVDISGSTALNYTLTSNEQGKVVRLVEIASNTAGSSAANYSLTSGVVDAAATTPAKPTITRAGTSGTDPFRFAIADDASFMPGYFWGVQRATGTSEANATANLLAGTLDGEVLEQQITVDDLTSTSDIIFPDLTGALGGPEALRVRVGREDGTGGALVWGPWSDPLTDTLPYNGFGAQDAAYTPSNRQRTETRAASGMTGIARGGVGITSGVPRYFEMKYENIGPDLVLLGLTSSATTDGNHTTSATDRWAAAGNANVYFSDGNFVGGGSGSIAEGDIMGLTYDPTADTIGVTDNAGSVHGPYPWNKAMGMFPYGLVSSAAGKITLNVTGPFFHTLPSGASAWNA